jgi:hypothetical protein
MNDGATSRPQMATLARLGFGAAAIAQPSVPDAQAMDCLAAVTVVAARAMHGGLIDGTANAQFRYRPVDPEAWARGARIVQRCHAGVPTTETSAGGTS